MYSCCGSLDGRTHKIDCDIWKRIGQMPRKIPWRRPVEWYNLKEYVQGGDEDDPEEIQAKYHDVLTMFRRQIDGTFGRERQIVLRTIEESTAHWDFELQDRLFRDLGQSHA